MDIVRWLGGVNKGLYDEIVEQCDNLRLELESKEKEISELHTENVKLRTLHQEAVGRCQSLEGKLEIKERELSELKADKAELWERIQISQQSL